MIAAHMDEIGMIVKYVNEKGFIQFLKGELNGKIAKRPSDVRWNFRL
jgi:putative aminopeptidase FrvX